LRAGAFPGAKRLRCKPGASPPFSVAVSELIEFYLYIPTNLHGLGRDFAFLLLTILKTLVPVPKIPNPVSKTPLDIALSAQQR
jgi:hypothetical protein